MKTNETAKNNRVSLKKKQRIDETKNIKTKLANVKTLYRIVRELPGTERNVKKPVKCKNGKRCW